MKRDSTLYLADIIENIDDASRFIIDLTFDQFVANKLVVNAVVRSIEIIGEATKHIPAEIRAQRPDVPWKDIAGMRDKCIHDYVGIDYEVVWTAVKEEFPEVLPKIKSLLDELRKTTSK